MTKFYGQIQKQIETFGSRNFSDTSLESRRLESTVWKTYNGSSSLKNFQWKLRELQVLSGGTWTRLPDID